MVFAFVDKSCRYMTVTSHVISLSLNKVWRVSQEYGFVVFCFVVVQL